MLLSWSAVASAAKRETREPLPAREVERPLLTPRGWVLAESATSAEVSATGLRFGLTRRFEIAGVLPVALDAPGLGASQVSARWALVDRESPAQGLSVEFVARSRAESGPEVAIPELGARVAWRRQGGAARTTGWLGVTSEERLETGAEVLLQAGPLWVSPRVDASVGPLGSSVGFGVRATLQLSRGLGAGLAWWRALAGEPGVLPATVDPSGSALSSTRPLAATLSVAL